jgi:dihydroxy-acid dehydratase
LNASPEAATGGGLAILKTDDRVRIDLNKRTADILISKAEYERRRDALRRRGGFKIPEHQTPWQEIQRGMVDELSRGMVLKPAVKYQRISTSKGVRDNHWAAFLGRPPEGTRRPCLQRESSGMKTAAARPRLVG